MSFPTSFKMDNGVLRVSTDSRTFFIGRIVHALEETDVRWTRTGR